MNLPSPLKGSSRSPKLEPTRPSTGQMEGASASCVQSPAKLAVAHLNALWNPPESACVRSA